ncbi:MAG: hypothetical protein HQL77_18285 [Magnetococcales bacterium]|nr:hypothetical protein [Magnetococcales bacterium]
MPQNEIVTFLQAGEKAIVTGPGRLELAIPKAVTAAGKGVAATGAAQTTVLTSGSAVAQPWAASLTSGKILGFNLAAVNPWILLGIGAIGGYYYMKKRRFRFF